MSVKHLVLVAAFVATSVAVADASTGARTSARASCGPATTFKSAPILQLGPVRMAGFSSEHCAWIRLRCGPNLGGYQAALSLELSKVPASPIVLRAPGSEEVKFSLVGSDTPAPKVPRCLPMRGGRAQVSLRAPNTYYVLFIFAPRGSSFRLTASRGGHRLGTAVLASRA
jgi:hypothetical protein